MAPEAQTMENTQQQPENASYSSKFVQRVSELPIVNSSLDYAYAFYGTTKDKYTVVGKVENQLKEKVVPRVEMITKQITSTPAAEKISKQLSSIDAYAVIGLEHLEKRIPMIKEHPSEILDHMKEGIDSVKTNINSNINTLKTTVPNEVNDLISKRLPMTVAAALNSIRTTIASLKDAQLNTHIEVALTELQGLISSIHNIPSTLQTLPQGLNTFVQRAQEAISTSPTYTKISNDPNVKRILTTLESRLETLNSLAQSILQFTKSKTSFHLNQPSEIEMVDSNGKEEEKEEENVSESSEETNSQ